MAKHHQKPSRSKSQPSKRGQKLVTLNLTGILGATIGLFVTVYLLEWGISYYFAPPPEYSQEYQDTYRQIGEQDKTNP